MTTPKSRRRRQPERKAKTQSARKQMSQRKPNRETLGATPTQHYLTIAQRNAGQSALLRLPLEIRHMIWTYVMHAQTVYVGYWGDSDSEDNTEHSILRVCRQVHAETCLLPYSVHSFWFDEIEYLGVWLKHRLPEQIAAIQRLEILCDNCKAEPLRLLPGLRYVHVYCVCDRRCPNDPARGKAIEEVLGPSGETQILRSKLRTHGRSPRHPLYYVVAEGDAIPHLIFSFPQKAYRPRRARASGLVRGGMLI